MQLDRPNHGYDEYHHVQGLHSRTTGPDIGVLYVRVLSGSHLAKKDIFGLSDPYCVLKIFDTQRTNLIAQTQTDVKKKTLNPKWNEAFYFRVHKQRNRVLFEIYDENRLTRDDFLGEVELPLDNIPVEATNVEVPFRDCLLQRRSARSHVRGHLRVMMVYLRPQSQNNEVQSGEAQRARHHSAIQEEEENTENVEDGGFIHVRTTMDQAAEEPGWETVNINDDIPAHPISAGRQLSNDTSLLPPLPSGWEEREDSNGRPYYINHANRNTTWERPQPDQSASQEDSRHRIQRTFSLRRRLSSPAVSPTEESPIEEEALPPGWEMRHDNNGRVFYLDNNTRTTTWTRPEAETQNQTNSPWVLSSDGVRSDSRERSSSQDSSSAQSQAPPSAPPQQEPQQPPSSERMHPDVPSATEIPLPAGWAMQLAANGRVFYVDHNSRATSWVDPRLRVRAESNQNLGPLPAGWEERVHADGRVFFIDHATQSTQWEDPRIQKRSDKTQAVPYSRDYKRKYDYFRSKLRKPDNVPNKYDINVTRSTLLEDSYRAVLCNTTNVNLLKTRLWIVFDGEVGLDYGGVTREWFYLLSKEAFNPYYGLFEYSATDNYTLQINPNSGLCNGEHLSYFKFIGRVAGMAVYHGKLLDAFFIRPFYKMMLERKITLTDMESVDSEYYNSLKWLQDNDPEPLDLRFQVEEEVFGVVQSVELKPGGGDIPVLEANKNEYINLVIKHRFMDCISEQMKKFKEGFYELIPKDLLKVFDERELEYLLCGLGEIDVEDWRKNSNYRGSYHDSHVVIQWFWKAVGTFDNEMRARLLQFVTGTSRVPMNGFAELYGSNGPQKFTIERWGNTHSLPRAHTCFNRIDLPPYTSYHELREKLRLAVENTEGFEGVD